MIPLLFAAGVLIATVAMFFGLGGGILWVPLLLAVSGLNAQEAVACSLMIQVCGQMSGTVSNLRQKLIDRRLLLQQAAVAAPAAVAGALLGGVFEVRLIEAALGALIFVIAYVFLRGGDLYAPGGETADLKAGRRVLGVSAFGGLICGLLSVGIGDWLVPAFNKRCRLTMARSVATSVALMALLSGVASASQLLSGRPVAFAVVLAGGSGAAVGAQLGTRAHRWVSEVRFKELFVLLLVFLGAHVFFNAF